MGFDSSHRLLRLMGRKHTVPYGLYVAHGFASAFLAKQTGFGEDDLELVFQALSQMFEHDRSAARGEMSTRGLYVFKHDKAPEVLDEIAVGSAAAVEAEKAAKAGGKDDADSRKAARDAYDEAVAKVREKVKGKYLLQKVEVGSPIRSTPVVANGVLYVMTESSLYAINPK